MKKNKKRILAAAMTVLMALTLIPTWLLGGIFATTAKAEGENTAVLNPSKYFPDPSAAEEQYKKTLEFDGFFVSPTVTDGTIKLGKSQKKLYKYSDTSKNITQADSDTAGFTSSGKANARLRITEKNSEVSFSVSGPATLYVWINGEDSKSVRKYKIYNKDTKAGLSGTYGKNKDAVSDSSQGVEASMSADMYADMFNITSAGTYAIANYEDGKSMAIYRVEVVPSAGTIVGSTVARSDWSGVTAPAIGSVTVDRDSLGISVPWTMKIGTGADEADYVRVKLYNKETNELVDTCVYNSAATSGTADFTVKDYGEYYAQVEAVRGGLTETLNSSKVNVTVDGPLKPAQVTIEKAANAKLNVTWEKVSGADTYKVYYKLNTESEYVLAGTVEAGDETEYALLVKGLVLNKTYDIKVQALRNGGTVSDDVSEQVASATTVASVEHTWTPYTNIGSGAKGEIYADDKKLTSGIDNGTKLPDKLTLKATGGKIGDSETGMIYYATKIDAADENFVLKGKFKVSEMNVGGTTNNQSGFGIMVVDTLNPGDNRYFNSVGAMTAKYLQTTYSEEEGTTQKTFNQIPGARIVTGYTDPTASKSSNTNTDAGKALLNNAHGFFTRSDGSEASEFALNDEYTFTLKKTNTGYQVTLNDDTDNEVIYYYPEELLKQNSDYVWVGFCASRYIQVDVTEMSFTTSNPATDEPAKPIPVEYTIPNVKILSGTTSGVEDYNFEYRPNISGHLVVTDEDGNVYIDKEVAANEYVDDVFKLKKGKTTFTCTLTPSSNEVLESYNDVVKEITVTYKEYDTGTTYLFASPDGSSSNTGYYDSPLDIYTAIGYAKPGQTVVLLDGTYTLSKGITISRGHNGTETNRITVTAENDNKAILDLSQIENSTGLCLVADYWTIYGIDVAYAPCYKGSPVTKAMHVQGSNNIVEMCNFYENGCSGLQISASSSAEVKDKWPANNLIKNCSAYNNADYVANDADGFAAKLTVGEGNKFYGCMSYNNIDDGYDLYAKSTTGSIGAVIIENSLAFNNGFVSDDSQIKSKLEPNTIGEGNGFKLGGESMSGKHQLINCVTFNNGAKGITSNSGPDCIVKNCTSYNNDVFLNEKENLSLYTNATEAAWQASGVISYYSADRLAKAKPDDSEGYTRAKNETIESVLDAIAMDETNYLFNGTACQNAKGVEVATAWFESLDLNVLPTRSANGTIDMHGLLVLTSAAPANSGARIDTTSDMAKSSKPVFSYVKSPDTGDSSNMAAPIAMMIACIMVMGTVVFFEKKKTVK